MKKLVTSVLLLSLLLSCLLLSGCHGELVEADTAARPEYESALPGCLFVT